jgi:hypothetical protein
MIEKRPVVIGYRLQVDPHMSAHESFAGHPVHWEVARA